MLVKLTLCFKMLTHCKVFNLIFVSFSSTGEATYAEVTAFLKKRPNAVVQYTSIVTSNETLTLTGNHLVYARSHFENQFKPM